MKTNVLTVFLLWNLFVWGVCFYAIFALDRSCWWIVLAIVLTGHLEDEAKARRK